MVEPCDRPGCGHESWDHDAEDCRYRTDPLTGAAFWIGSNCADEDADSCSCPGYRTPEQQEAIAALDGLSHYPGDGCAGGEECRYRTAVGLVLKAFP